MRTRRVRRSLDTLAVLIIFMFDGMGLFLDLGLLENIPVSTRNRIVIIREFHVPL